MFRRVERNGESKVLGGARGGGGAIAHHSFATSATSTDRADCRSAQKSRRAATPEAPPATSGAPGAPKQTPMSLQEALGLTGRHNRDYQLRLNGRDTIYNIIDLSGFDRDASLKLISDGVLARTTASGDSARERICDADDFARRRRFRARRFRATPSASRATVSRDADRVTRHNHRSTRRSSSTSNRRRPPATRTPSSTRAAPSTRFARCRRATTSAWSRCPRAPGGPPPPRRRARTTSRPRSPWRRRTAG